VTGAEVAGGDVTGGAVVVVVAIVVVELTKVVVDFTIVVVVVDVLGFSTLDDPHAERMPRLRIDTQTIAAEILKPVFIFRPFLAY
jgi:hypothetical protein